MKIQFQDKSMALNIKKGVKWWSAGKIKESRGKLFQGWRVWNDNCCLPLTLFFLYLSLSNPPLPSTLNFRPFNAQNFSNHRRFSQSLCASHDKYRPLLPFPNELWHVYTPPNHAQGHTVYKGPGWVAAWQWEKVGIGDLIHLKQVITKLKEKRSRKEDLCVFLFYI